MSGQQVVPGKSLLGEIPPEIAIDKIDITKSPEVEAIQLVDM
jgi:hypothetical protein